MLELKGALVTIDAMGCQKAIAKAIRDIHGLISSLISLHLAASSEGKKKSSRENGKKGGRPRRAA
jgi:predicted transposase YbfD/YdcC